ncbi:PLP-dependent aminotransferase family protein [Sphingomonas sp.]|uniref:MocR-like pyridoxine biosynthesis transcription factor PdxR n=1 Tax=Sphingomonas sp. TaxID=28214 RepID=UPI003B002183
MRRPWKVALRQRIDPSSQVPLYRQIAQAIVREIESGGLGRGEYLPSSRDLAEALGVNRKTVVLTFEDLVAQGWLETSGTRGTMVARTIRAPDPHLRAPEADDAGTARVAYAYSPPPRHAPARLASPSAVLDEGSPDGRLFPLDALTRAQRDATRRAFRENRLLYRDPRGSPMLREQIAAMLKTERGLPVTADNICVTRGSQNGIYLAARALVSRDDVVVVEELTYEPAVAAFSAHGARILTVPLDRDGIDVAALEEICREHRVRAVFLTPHHQFPTTVSLRPERRLGVIELSRRHGFAVIEDDYDHEFHFGSRPLLPMASYAPEQVIYVGSLSKLLLPALRIGYLAAPSAFIQVAASWVSLIDGLGNTLMEDAVAEIVGNGELRRHAKRATQIYARRREAFAATLDASLGDVASFDMPDGGLAVWLRFRDQHVLDRTEERAAALGLRLAPSRSFAARKDAASGLRLGFGSLAEDEARSALALLAEATA